MGAPELACAEWGLIVTFAEQALIEIIERTPAAAGTCMPGAAPAKAVPTPQTFTAEQVEKAIAKALASLPPGSSFATSALLVARYLNLNMARLARRQQRGTPAPPKANAPGYAPIFEMVARETGFPPKALAQGRQQGRVITHARALFILACFDPGTTGAEKPSRARQPMPGEIMKPKRFYGQGGIADIARAMGLNHASVLKYARDLGLTSCCCGARPRAFTPLHPIRPIITLKDMT